MTEPLPILLWHLGRRGGGPRYTLELARELARRDDVRLHLALSRQSELFAETAALGAPMLAIDTYTDVAGFALGFARLPAIRRRLREYVRQHRIPVALCSMAHLWNAWLVPALKQGGAANALVVHDAQPHPGDNQRLRRRMIGRDIAQADLVITLSAAVAGQVASVYGVDKARIAVSAMPAFRYGGAADRQPRRLGPPPHRLLFFGRLLPYKGLDQLIEAMRLLETRGVAVRLSIVGDGPLALPEALPASVAVDRRWVAEAEIPALFAEADLVVLPYQEASQSGVIPIARHLGLPSLVTPVGGLVEQVDGGNAGFIAAGTRAEAIAQAIAAAVADAETYARLSAGLLAGDGDARWAEAAEAALAALRRFA